MLIEVRMIVSPPVNERPTIALGRDLDREGYLFHVAIQLTGYFPPLIHDHVSDRRILNWPPFASRLQRRDIYRFWTISLLSACSSSLNTKESGLRPTAQEGRPVGNLKETAPRALTPSFVRPHAI